MSIPDITFADACVLGRVTAASNAFPGSPARFTLTFSLRGGGSASVDVHVVGLPGGEAVTARTGDLVRARGEIEQPGRILVSERCGEFTVVAPVAASQAPVEPAPAISAIPAHGQPVPSAAPEVTPSEVTPSEVTPSEVTPSEVTPSEVREEPPAPPRVTVPTPSRPSSPFGRPGGIMGRQGGARTAASAAIPAPDQPTAPLTVPGAPAGLSAAPVPTAGAQTHVPAHAAGTAARSPFGGRGMMGARSPVQPASTTAPHAAVTQPDRAAPKPPTAAQGRAPGRGGMLSSMPIDEDEAPIDRREAEPERDARPSVPVRGTAAQALGDRKPNTEGDNLDEAIPW